MDRYDIDDILEEARHLKERHKDMPASSGPVEPAPRRPPVSVADEPPVIEPLPPVVTVPWEEPEEEPRKKRVRSFFSKKKEKAQEWEDEWDALAAPEKPTENTGTLPLVAIPLVPAQREKPGPHPSGAGRAGQAAACSRTRPCQGRRRHPGYRFAAEGADG